MGIDFLCAFALYRSFAERPEAFLLYNFCAVALQMPLGIIIDVLSERYEDRYLPGLIFTVAGIVLTVCGSFISHIVLGLGNALFHVGGGVITISEDDDNDLEGRGLGTFVAPGAIGLILGILHYDTVYFTIISISVSLILFMIAIILSVHREKCAVNNMINSSLADKDLIRMIAACFIVVIIRSLNGMALSFPWKVTDLLTIISVLCLAFGKTAGGFIAARFGSRRTIILSLVLSAVSYVYADRLIPGLMALFFFNMTMPVTLYLLVRKMPDKPGFAFGILTFALFIGYLPVHYGLLKGLSPFPFGTVASLLSLLILAYALMIFERGER